MHFSGLVLLHFQDGLLFEGRLFHSVSELGGDQDRRIVVDGLVDSGHDPQAHELGDHVAGLDAHSLGEIRKHDGVVDLDSSLDGLGRGDLGLLTLGGLGLAALLAFPAFGAVKRGAFDHLLALEPAFLLEEPLVLVLHIDLLASFFLSAASGPVGLLIGRILVRPRMVGLIGRTLDGVLLLVGRPGIF